MFIFNGKSYSNNEIDNLLAINEKETINLVFRKKDLEMSTERLFSRAKKGDDINSLIEVNERIRSNIIELLKEVQKNAKEKQELENIKITLQENFEEKPKSL